MKVVEIVTNAKRADNHLRFRHIINKFINGFKFSFQESTYSITNSLLQNWDSMEKVNRKEKIIYEA